MAQIAIVGATGFVGTALSLCLLDLGHHVVAVSRRPERWPIQHKNLKVLKGDLLDGENLDELLRGADAAYYLVHGLDEAEEDFEWAEAQCATRFTQAVIKAKVHKVIFLGALGPHEDVSKHLRSRHLVGEILSLIPGVCVELRASIVLGANSTSFEMVKALHQRLPIRPYAPWLETLCQPIALDDLIKYLIAAMELKLVGHHIVEIGGKDAVPYGELLDLYAKIDGHTRPKMLLPAIDQRMLLPAIDVLLPEFSEVGKKLFMSLEYPTVLSDNTAERVFPDIEPLPLDEAMKRAFHESNSNYPAVWEGDFWKELRDATLLQTRQGQQAVLDKLKELAEAPKEMLEQRLSAMGKLRKNLGKRLKRSNKGKRD